MVNLPKETWMAIGLIFFAVVCATVALVFLLEAFRERSRNKRVTRQLKLLELDNLSRDDGTKSLFRADESPTPRWLEPIARRLPHLRDVDILIEQSGLNWSSQTFLILSTGFGLAFGLGSALAARGPIGFVVGGAIGCSLPYFYIRFKRERRMRAFEDGLPEAIDLLGRALRAGHPLSAGLRMIGEEMTDPIAAEFRRVFEEQRFGLSMEDSMHGLADRIPLVDVRIFVTAVLIQREVGGNLAEILDKLSYVIRQRFSILRQLRTFTAQGRMSGYVLGGLPIFLGFAMFALNSEDMMAFIQHPLGRMFMTAAIILQVLGYIAINRIIKIEV